MIQSLLVIPEQHGRAVRSAALSAAYQRATQAYAAARRDVYDLHGGRAPAADQLTGPQQDLLDELTAAEAALHLQRQREWQQADADLLVGEPQPAD